MLTPITSMTRRELIRDGGIGLAGVVAAGGLGGFAGKLISGTPAVAQPPLSPRWVSRPDLQIPGLTVLRREPGASRDPIFMAPYNAPNAQAGAVIVDASGEPLWENPVADRVTTNFKVQSYRGEPVLVWWEGEIELGHGVGEYVIADSSYRPIRRIQAGNGRRGDLHEFVITPRDTALLTTYEVTRANLRSVGGSPNGTIQDALFQEIDLASGQVLMEWHSLDHVGPRESYAPLTPDWDYFHINSVDFDHDGNLLISSRSTHTIYKIARNGEILWRLGGGSSDFAMGEGASFAWQHHARRLPDGTLSVFDNGATPAVEPLSRGLVLALDETAMQAELIHQYTRRGILSGSQGSVQELPSGNVFIGWGEVPRVSEFSRDGRLLFDALLAAKHESYRAFRMPWRGTPASSPSIAVKTPGRSRATVYASWNGATDVRSWQLLGGSSRNSLQPVRTVPAVGFETTLAAGEAGAHVAVEALDAAGTPLGRSTSAAVPA
jgi:Arylsulfotransferase (ASST)